MPRRLLSLFVTLAMVLGMCPAQGIAEELVGAEPAGGDVVLVEGEDSPAGEELEEELSGDDELEPEQEVLPDEVDPATNGEEPADEVLSDEVEDPAPAETQSEPAKGTRRMGISLMADPTGAYASYVNTTTTVKFNDMDW